MSSATNKRVLSTKKRILFRLGRWVVLLLLLFAIAEGVLRLTGRGPRRLPDYVLVRPTVEPGGRFHDGHPTLGWALLPGRFRVTHPGTNPGDTFSWTVTHGPDTLRITRPTEASGHSDRLLWIFGCSFTYGASVNDEETYPWLLQEKLPEYRVLNFAVSGYGTLQSLLQLKTALDRREKPDVVVLAYGSFHDQRNTLARNWRGLYRTGAEGVNLPYARMDANGKIHIRTWYLVPNNNGWVRRSAVLHALDQLYDRWDDGVCRSVEVSRALLKEFSDICASNGVPLVVAGILPDSDTAATLAYCASNGIRTIDVAVNTQASGYSNLPYDPHPSAKAHKEYAHKLYAYLKASGVLMRP